MRSRALLVSGDISKVSNVAAAPISHTLFLQQRLDHLRSSARPVLTPGGTFQRIGMLPRVPRSGAFFGVDDVWLNFSSSRWLYTQFIAVDANFKLKLKNRRINDPELGSGWSYFVENSPYTRHIANNPHDKEVSCFAITQEFVLIPVLGHQLWKRVPCCQPSKLTRRQGLYCERCCQGRLRAALLCPSKCRRRPSTWRTVRDVP